MIASPAREIIGVRKTRWLNGLSTRTSSTLPCLTRVCEVIEEEPEDEDLYEDDEGGYDDDDWVIRILRSTHLLASR